MSRMPNLPVEIVCENCDEYGGRIVRVVCNRKTGCLRATKPYRRIDFDGDEDEALFQARANYVWRMLCFDYCGFHPHNCMPVCADWDISCVYYGREKRNEYANSADRRVAERADRDAQDALIKRIESTLPITAQKGTMQWAQALGMLSVA